MRVGRAIVLILDFVFGESAKPGIRKMDEAANWSYHLHSQCFIRSFGIV